MLSESGVFFLDEGIGGTDPLRYSVNLSEGKNYPQP